MPSSLPGKNEPPNRRVSTQEPVVVPERAPETDDSPTVISKAQPTIEPNSSYKNKITNLGRQASTPEEIVAGLRGRQLAHFELIEPIGVGGMAAVIRARDTQLDRFVALKILPPEMAQEQENIDRFHQEARAAAKLDHENIARVFFCGEDQGLFFIAFEFVEGDNLRTIMERRGQLPVAESVRYILQIAAGLEHAATRGVVHRDVKPSNIIITPTGRAKLVDMGLARNLERRGERDLTQSGMTLGTFDYVSPEQALEPRDADSRSDIYSLGCTLYHMLTGKPPVPEGTPAKKLQHHQMHFPIDPRHFAPGVPDELVLILSKMMAKNPRDRYQRPVHLVQHLMQVAKKVGIADDLPEGVLLVDTPFHRGPMRAQPMLWVGLALTLLVAITLILTVAPGPLPSNPKGGAPHSEVKDSKAQQVSTDSGKKKEIPQDNRQALPTAISNKADLQMVLDDPSAEKKSVTIVGDVNLESGAFLKGGKDQRFEFKTENADENGMFFHYQSANSPFGLLIEGGEEVEFYRVKFQIDSDSTPLQAVAAVALRGVKKATFKQCVFVQPKVPRMTPPRKGSGSKQVPLASLYIDTSENAENAQPEVNLIECFFEGNDKTGGQVAIAINGPANVNVTNCAFKPHATLFQFRKECSKEKTIVNVQYSASYVVHGPAFRFNLNASATIRAKHNVFSRPEGSPLPPQGLPFPNLLHLTDSFTPIEYFGTENLYHNLNAYVASSDKLIADKEEFIKFLGKKGQDVGSKETTSNPWYQTGSLDHLDELAFQLKAEYQDKYGLQKTWRGERMPSSAIAVVNPAPVAQPKLKIVDADDKGKTLGIFGKLAGAIGEAQDGDVILIKHGEDREVVMPHVGVRPGVSITLRPFDENYHPILVLDKAFRDKDTTLFKIQDSKLTIEQMEIRLDPQGIDTGSQSIVLMGETAHCHFKNCVLTLRSANDVKLNAVTFVDLDRMMKMETPTVSSARVEFTECFVRGTGDLVGLNGCRLLHVEMKNTLVALDGSLLDLQAGAKPMPMSQGVRWKMERSSIYTSDSLFVLHSRGGKGLTKMQAELDGCLLWSLSPEKAIAIHDMTDKIDEQLPTYLDWRGEQNFYANFDAEKVRDWKEQFKETKSEYARTRFADIKDEIIPKLWDATPEWFRPAQMDIERMAGFGIPLDIEKRLMPTKEEP